MIGKSSPKEVSISAVVKRADGTIENLGIISYNHKSLFKRLIFKINKYKNKFLRRF